MSDARSDLGLIDDFGRADGCSRLGTHWRLITDQVMGGVSSATVRPWQSYRATFTTAPAWSEARLPFGGFRAHRVTSPLDPRRLKRIALVAIGAARHAEVCIGELTFF